MTDEQRREDGADGVRVCQQCGCNAVKAHSRQAGGVQGVPLTTAGQIEQTGTKACQCTGNRHGQNDVFLFIDTGIAGGVLVQANGFQLIAKGRFFQHDPHHNGHDDGQKDGDGGVAGVEQFAHPAGRDLRLRGVGGQLPGAGVMRIIHHAGAAAIDDLIDKVQTDPVEHDRGNNFVDVQVRLKDAGNGPPQRTEHSGYQQAHPPGHAQHNGKVQSAESAQRVLPCCANVEQAGFERKGNRKAGHDQRGGLGQHLAAAIREVIKAALQNAPEAIHQGVLRVDDKQRNQADDQANDNAHECSQNAAAVLADGCAQRRLVLFCHGLLCLLLFCTGHIQAQFLHGGGLGIKFAHDLAFVHHQYAV